MSKVSERKPSSLPRSRLPWKLQQALRFLDHFFYMVSQYRYLFIPYLKQSFTNFLKANKKERPTIFVCIDEKPHCDPLIGAGGRHFYHILRTLALSGHNVNLYKTIKFEDFISLGKFGRLIYSIENLKIVSKVPEETEDKIYVYDEEDKACAGKKWKKSVRISYDILSALKQAPRPMIMPFPMFPGAFLYGQQEGLKIFRDNERKFRIFFSGDVQKYHGNLSKVYQDMLTRLQAIEAIRCDLDDESKTYVTNEEEFDALFDGEYRDKFILVDTDKIWVKPEYWLDTISGSDLFLCAPGDFYTGSTLFQEAISFYALPAISCLSAIM